MTTKKGYKRSEESIRKQIKTITGRKRPPFTQQHRDNIAASLRGRPGTRKGKKMSEEQLIEYRKTIANSPTYIERNRKISLALKGVPKSPEHIHKGVETRKAQGQTSWCKGLTKETNPSLQRISEKLKGRVMDQSWLDKLSLAHKGKPSPKKGKAGKIRNPGRRIRIWFKKLPMRVEIGPLHWWISENRKGIKNGFYGKKHSAETHVKFANRKWGPYRDSKPERMMQIALALNGIKFIKHKPIKLGKRWHQPDILIEPNIIVEVDGVYHHMRDDRIRRDLWKSQEMTLLGYHVIRIRDKDILKNTQNCADKVIELIKELQHRHIPLD